MGKGEYRFMKYTTETIREIWPDEGDGERYEIGPDRDDLGLIEIRLREGDGKVHQNITISVDAAIHIIKALAECANELSANGQS